LDAFRQLQSNHERHPGYEAESDDVAPPEHPLVNLVAFYLPQFHPIAENDAWWGKGFTEWTNVSKALPHFPGHYQPRLPSDLGFYDLRLPETLRAQASLAKRYGIGAFCFHWFWFGGKRLLETPLNTLRANPDIDLPFFINWANENWTRRWDGKEKSILLAQKYGPDDDLALADAFLDIMRDPRYVRIDGRPVVMLYRPFLMPDAAATVDRWRTRFAECGENDPYVLMDYCDDAHDPRRYGIDAAVQYPPHNLGPDMARNNELHAVYETTYNGAIFEYGSLVERMLDMPEPAFKLFRGVCPTWDNTARRPNDGMVFTGSTPRAYGRWLAETAQRTFEACPASERLVFINAWNEWAEGAYLEPDRRFGHAYLRETARALHAVSHREVVDAFAAERVDERVDSPPAASPLRRFVVKAGRKVARTLNRANGDR
jgi:lipopolysaccharide biosynthesis protein